MHWFYFPLPIALFAVESATTEWEGYARLASSLGVAGLAVGGCVVLWLKLQKVEAKWEGAEAARLADAKEYAAKCESLGREMLEVFKSGMKSDTEVKP